MNKFESIAGYFACRICGTIYQWSDLRDQCEGLEWFKDDVKAKRKLLKFIEQRQVIIGTPAYDVLRESGFIADELNVQVGEQVIVTRYVGDDYAQPPFKPGIKLLWSVETVREQRIIPEHKNDERLHVAQYKIGEASAGAELIGDHWDAPRAAGGFSIGFAIGQSYAIPTKDAQLRTLPLEKIQTYIGIFLDYARQRSDLQFFVTRIGCGLAGYSDEDIGPTFFWRARKL